MRGISRRCFAKGVIQTNPEAFLSGVSLFAGPKRSFVVTPASFLAAVEHHALKSVWALK